MEFVEERASIRPMNIGSVSEDQRYPAGTQLGALGKPGLGWPGRKRMVRVTISGKAGWELLGQ